MKNILHFPDNKAIREEAAWWVARLDGSELSAEQKEGLQVWLAQDPRHQQALIDMAKLWGQLDVLSVLAELFPLHPHPTAQQLPRFSSIKWLQDHRLATAATLMVSTCLALTVVFVLNSAPQQVMNVVSEPVELVYQTELGQQSTAKLKDGSTMALNTESVARVRYDDQERAVFLEKGEAHFNVTKNHEIPFVVYAGNGKVRAVGTAFNVRVNEQQVDVTVSEGTVQVITPKLSDLPATHNEALTSITLTERGIVRYRDTIESYTYIEPQELAHKLAWKSGKWIFEGETLAYVIAEANRYTSDVIEISDPHIANLRVGGYFDVGDVPLLLAALEAGFGIKVTRPVEGVIQLSSLNAPSSPPH